MRLQLAWLRDALDSLRRFDWSELRYASACGNWPVAVHVVICIGSVALVLVLGCLVLLPGLSASWHAARDQTFALEREHTALQEQFDINFARHVSMATRCPQCLVLQRYLSPSDVMPVVLDRLSEKAATHEIRVTALRPEISWQDAYLRAFEIDVQLRADQRKLTAFLTDIGALPLAFAIKQADWNLATQHASLSLFLLVDENQNSEGPVDYKIETPGTAAAIAANSSGDIEYDFAEGHWQRVAFVQRGNRFLEVLRDVRGETHRRVGELTEAGQ